MKSPQNHGVGNFIIGASGSDKQMLYGFYGARNYINCKQDPKKAGLSFVVWIRSYGREVKNKGECGAMLWSFDLFSKLR